MEPHFFLMKSQYTYNKLPGDWSNMFVVTGSCSIHFALMNSVLIIRTRFNQSLSMQPSFLVQNAWFGWAAAPHYSIYTTTLYCTALLYYTLHFTTLHRTTPHCSITHYTLEHYTAPHHTTLLHTKLYNTTL